MTFTPIRVPPYSLFVFSLLLFFLRPALSLSADLQTRFQHGVQALQEGRLAEAEADFRAILAADPENAPALFNLGSALELQGKYPEAERVFREVLRLQPDGVTAYLHLAQIALARGDVEGSYENYFNAYWLSPEGSQVERLGEEGLAALHTEEELRDGFEAAQQAIQEGRLAEGEGRLREILAIAPKNPTFWNALGIVLGIEGKFDDSLAALRETVRLRPDFFSALIRIGELLELKGELDQARESYEAALLTADRPDQEGDADRRLRAVEDRIELKEFLGQGDAFFDQGEIETAARVYLAASERYPEEALPYLKAGTAFGRLNRLDQALSYFEKAVEKNPEEALAWVRIGQVQETMRLFGRAEKSYREALSRAGAGPIRSEIAASLKRLQRTREQAEKEAAARIAEGKELLDKGLTDEGLERLRQASSLTPEDPRVHALLAPAYLERGEINLAINALLGVVEFDPNDVGAHAALARLYAGKRLYERALRELDIAEGLREDSVFSELRGRIVEGRSEAIQRQRPLLAEAERRMNQGDLAGASDAAGRAISERPDDPEARALLAKIDAERRQWVNARAEWETALLFDPTSARYTLGLAKVLEEGGALNEAKKTYEKALGLLRPDDQGLAGEAREGMNRVFGRLFSDREARRYHRRGFQKMRKGDYAGAEQAFQVVLSYQPDNAVAQHELAFSKQRQGKLAEAVSGYQRAILLNPNFAEPRLYLGGVYQTEGRFPEVIEQYRTVRTILEGTGTPEEARVKEELARLERRYDLRFTQTDIYDSNPDLGPGQKGEFYSTLGLNFNYYLIKRQRLLLPVGLSTYNFFFFSNEQASTNNSLSVSAQVFLGNLSSTLGYNFNYGLAPGGISNSSNSGSAEVTFTGSLPTALTVRYDYQRFTSYLDPLFNADRNSVRVTASQSFFSTEVVSLSYLYLSNDVVFPFLTTRNQSGSLSYSHSFSDSLKGTLGYSVSVVRYTQPNPLELLLEKKIVRRRNVGQSVTAGLNYLLRRNISVFFSVTQEWNRSNLPNFKSVSIPDTVLEDLASLLVLVGDRQLILQGYPSDTGPYTRTQVSASLNWTF